MAVVKADHTRTLDMQEKDGVVVQLTRLFRVIELTGTDYRVLTNALATSGVPEYGDKLSTPTSLANLIVVDRRAELVDEDQAVVDVTVTYEHFNNDAQNLDTPPVGQFIPTGRSTLQQVEANLDRNGLAVEVQYDWPRGDARGDDIQAINAENGYPQSRVEVQGGRMSYAQPQRTLIVRGKKGTNRPWLIQAAIEGTTNVGSWQGGAPDQWLCTGVEFVPVDVSVARNDWIFTFEFTFNPDGWQPFVTFIDPRTGKPPTGLEAGVGYKTVNVYNQQNFESIIGQRIRG